MLSTECVQDWHAECPIPTRGCGCDCHADFAPVRARNPKPAPSGVSSRERVYAAIVAHHQDHGMAPTVRQLSAVTGLALGTINYHVHRLDALGWITMLPGLHRTVTPVGVR
jgi:hypothetical protein